MNPIAGMGGRVGLKGTDGREALRRARELGATPVAANRMSIALRHLVQMTSGVSIVCCPGIMGEDVVHEAGMEPDEVLSVCLPQETGPADTEEAARAMARCGVDLLLFAGGDGTARDILSGIGEEAVVLGVPAGVKMHSAVFATDPRSAGELAGRFLRSEVDQVVQAEVMDIDEEAFRAGRVSAKLYGHMQVPQSDLTQGLKSASGQSHRATLEGMGAYVAELMSDEETYIIGPGSTTRAITDELGLQKTLLGVDVVRGDRVVFQDAAERELLDAAAHGPCRIIVTPIGGQGYIFGRGNQQISPAVIRSAGTDRIWVVATREKLLSLERRPLRVDTGDAELDEELRGYARVITDYRQESRYPVG